MPPSYRPDLPRRLPDTGLLGRDGKPYHATAELLAAANVALALRRPLLLTGEPGCGKTDFAYAAEGALRLSAGTKELAEADSDGLLESQIRSDSRARDLLYDYDALSRFNDAQHGDPERARDARRYVQLLPLGRALTSERMRVLLIDEIDKAPRDLPNDLLRELDRGALAPSGNLPPVAFVIPEIPPEVTETGSPLRREMRRPSDPSAWPFVVITSNSERQLPDPFLRRCVFFHMKFPDRDSLAKILKDRFVEFPDAGQLIGPAVSVFEALRAVPRIIKKPTTAELIDWTEAMLRVFQPESALEGLTRAAAGIEEGRAGSGLRWAAVPALPCLVKLQEDLKCLGLA